MPASWRASFHNSLSAECSSTDRPILRSRVSSNGELSDMSGEDVKGSEPESPESLMRKEAADIAKIHGG